MTKYDASTIIANQHACSEHEIVLARTVLLSTKSVQGKIDEMVNQLTKEG